MACVVAEFAHIFRVDIEHHIGSRIIAHQPFVSRHPYVAYLVGQDGVNHIVVHSVSPRQQFHLGVSVSVCLIEIDDTAARTCAEIQLPLFIIDADDIADVGRAVGDIFNKVVSVRQDIEPHNPQSAATAHIKRMFSVESHRIHLVADVFVFNELE